MTAPRVRRWPEALLACAMSVVALAAAARLAGLRLNLTGSIPAGVYRVVGAGSGALTRGAIVLVCLPPDVAAFAHARGYVPSGGGTCAGGTLPVGKVVIAIGGDTVTVSAGGLAVNGVPVPASRPLARDSRGRVLPRLASGRYIVRQDELWLGSRSPRGFDARYFGAVPASAVRGRLAQCWTASALLSPR